MDSTEDQAKYIGFKLISLEVKDHSLLTSVNYSFVDSKDPQDKIYTTVIIGPNGTGKSNLFRTIIELFKELYDLSQGRSRSYYDGKFCLRYSAEGDIFEYSNFERTNQKKHTYLLKNKTEIDFKNVRLPQVIVANSIMLTDKYPIYSYEGAFPIYKYVGVRNRTQNASTRSYVRKTIEFIVEQLDSSGLREALQRVTDFLEISGAIEIYYHTANTAKFFKGQLTRESFEDYFEPIKTHYESFPGKAPFKVNHYSKISTDLILIDELCQFCNNLYNTDRLTRIGGSRTKKLSYVINDENSFQKLKSEFKLLEHLRLLGMLGPPEVFLKRSSPYLLQESSSGEYHFFSSMVSLMATVKPNSLIFIDEPEISLHPNWQMRYLTFLRQLFSTPEFGTAHILIATHSHFLISDLEGRNSKIIGLKLNEKIQTVDFGENVNTYGWSAENVLLNVFDVATTRNYYIADRLAHIFKIASKNMDVDLSGYKEELLKWHGQLTEEDPLRYTIEKLIRKKGWLG